MNYGAFLSFLLCWNVACLGMWDICVVYCRGWPGRCDGQLAGSFEDGLRI